MKRRNALKALTGAVVLPSVVVKAASEVVNLIDDRFPHILVDTVFSKGDLIEDVFGNVYRFENVIDIGTDKINVFTIVDSK